MFRNFTGLPRSKMARLPLTLKHFLHPSPVTRRGHSASLLLAKMFLPLTKCQQTHGGRRQAKAPEGASVHRSAANLPSRISDLIPTKYLFVFFLTRDHTEVQHLCADISLTSAARYRHSVICKRR